MDWACMAASEMGSLIFIDYGTPDYRSSMSAEIYRNVLFANLKRNTSSLIVKTLTTKTKQTKQNEKKIKNKIKLPMQQSSLSAEKKKWKV